MNVYRLAGKSPNSNICDGQFQGQEDRVKIILKPGPRQQMDVWPQVAAALRNRLKKWVRSNHRDYQVVRGQMDWRMGNLRFPLDITYHGCL